MPQLKKIDLLPVLAIVLFALWYAVPSSLFLKPVSWQISGTEVTFIRATPYGDVTADWSAEITLLERNGFECYGQGNSVYQAEPTDRVSYEIGDWARRCVTAGPPFTIRLSWQVLLFDVIPLRRTKTVLFVESVTQGRPASPTICR